MSTYLSKSIENNAPTHVAQPRQYLYHRWRFSAHRGWNNGGEHKHLLLGSDPITTADPFEESESPKLSGPSNFVCALKHHFFVLAKAVSNLLFLSLANQTSSCKNAVLPGMVCQMPTQYFRHITDDEGCKICRPRVAKKHSGLYRWRHRRLCYSTNRRTTCRECNGTDADQQRYSTCCATTSFTFGCRRAQRRYSIRRCSHFLACNKTNHNQRRRRMVYCAIILLLFRCKHAQQRY